MIRPAVSPASLLMSADACRVVTWALTLLKSALLDPAL